jgi:CDP-glucose 4,6-dehydratase
MEKMVNDLFAFYYQKKVFITGHTGFKGVWLSLVLKYFGAEVHGFSIGVPTDPSLFELIALENLVHSYKGDIKDYKILKKTMDAIKPEVVFHLAAQPLVIESYLKPLDTYQTNVNGTLNLLEVIRTSDYVKSFINVTTDKVYKNQEFIWGYRETEELDGFDPYSNSKSCSELITRTYRRALIINKCAISTVRAGNVIGGGDFSSNRIVPDIMKKILASDILELRNPNSTRPYQHVLEPIFAYSFIAVRQYQNIELSGEYNVGPDSKSEISTEKLVNLFLEKTYKNFKVEKKHNANSFHEANYLKLDNTKIKTLGIYPKWSIEKAVDMTLEWIKVFENEKSQLLQLMSNQIKEFFEE